MNRIRKSQTYHVIQGKMKVAPQSKLFVGTILANTLPKTCSFWAGTLRSLQDVALYRRGSFYCVNYTITNPI